MITNIDELTQNEAVAYLKADLWLSDPDNYSLDEKREICEEMAATSEAIEEAMRKDFSELPPRRAGCDAEPPSESRPRAFRLVEIPAIWPDAGFGRRPNIEAPLAFRARAVHRGR